MTTKLKRLIDLPGVADLELKALMKPGLAAPENRADYPEIDACARDLFGLTPDEAEAVPGPADWDGIDNRPVPEQVEAFEASGWDVTDNRRRPLRTLGHFSQPLWLALRGVAGTLPFVPEEDTASSPWGSTMASDAARFRRR